MKHVSLAHIHPVSHDSVVEKNENRLVYDFHSIPCRRFDAPLAQMHDDHKQSDELLQQNLTSKRVHPEHDGYKHQPAKEVDDGRYD